jgi:transcriptional repressor NrdR
MVIKRDNRREPFSRDKMREGIQRACQKRPISPAAIERVVAEVEYSLQDFVLEVPSVEIGQRILKRLYELDAVAYVRFASVYRSFGDVDAFMSELRRVKRAHQRRAGLTAAARNRPEFSEDRPPLLANGRRTDAADRLVKI